MRAWRHMPVISALRRQKVPKLEDHEASLGYTVVPIPKSQDGDATVLPSHSQSTFS